MRASCSFAIPIVDRVRTEVARQAGNSMQLMVIGAVLQYAWLFTRWEGHPPAQPPREVAPSDRKDGDGEDKDGGASVTSA